MFDIFEVYAVKLCVHVNTQP